MILHTYVLYLRLQEMSAVNAETTLRQHKLEIGMAMVDGQDHVVDILLRWAARAAYYYCILRTVLYIYVLENDDCARCRAS